jgi:hypothetical protein
MSNIEIYTYLPLYSFHNGLHLPKPSLTHANYVEFTEPPPTSVETELNY